MPDTSDDTTAISQQTPTTCEYGALAMSQPAWVDSRFGPTGGPLRFNSVFTRLFQPIMSIIFYVQVSLFRSLSLLIMLQTSCFECLVRSLGSWAVLVAHPLLLPCCFALIGYCCALMRCMSWCALMRYMLRYNDVCGMRACALMFVACAPMDARLWAGCVREARQARLC